MGQKETSLGVIFMGGLYAGHMRYQLTICGGVGERDNFTKHKKTHFLTGWCISLHEGSPYLIERGEDSADCCLGTGHVC